MKKEQIKSLEVKKVVFDMTCEYLVDGKEQSYKKGFTLQELQSLVGLRSDGLKLIGENFKITPMNMSFYDCFF